MGVERCISLFFTQRRSLIFRRDPQPPLGVYRAQEMRATRWGRKAAALVAVIALAGAVLVWGYRHGLFGVTPPPGITLTDLHSVGQLESLFAAGQGSTRLVLIMSPT